MSGHSAEEVKSHVRGYVMVFLALMVLTAVTVGVSYLHVSTTMGIAIGLFVACIKGSLVSLYFMHLISEKNLIRYILLMTVFFFFGCLLIPVLSQDWPVPSLYHVGK